MVDGRCRFCGYRLTEADLNAYRRLAVQKQAFGAGPPEKEPVRRQPWTNVAAAPEREARAVRKAPAGKPVRDAPRREPPRKAPKPSQHARRPRARDGPGFIGRMLPRLLVIGWALLLLYLMLQELPAGMPP